LEKKGILVRPLIYGMLLVTTSVPMLANASSVVATFDWVPTTENPATAQSVIPSGILQLTLSSFALTGTSNPPNFGPYYASGAASTVQITGFSYTAGDGLTANLSNVTAESLGTTTIWETSGLDKPLTGPQAPSAPTQGYYLVSSFTLSGKTAQGSPFMIASVAGTPGATYSNGVPNADNTFNAAATIPTITDGGYWELASVTPVPLPASLSLMLAGVGGVGVFARRRKGLSRHTA
jgi:hypothetical protein